MKPLRDEVLIRVQVAEAVTPGGIYLPEEAREKEFVGEIVAVGPACRYAGAEHIGKGATWAPDHGREILGDDGRDYILLREGDILGILEGKDIEP